MNIQREAIRQMLRERYHGAIEPTEAMIDAVLPESASPGVLPYLQDNGYEPQEPGRGFDGEWQAFDLTASGVGTVRLVIWPDDGPRMDIHRFDKYMATDYTAGFSPGTPAAVVLAALAAAEDELAWARGGPVTPRQEASAR